MNKESLARRNQRLAAAIHQPSWKRRTRDLCLEGLARLPFAATSGSTGRILIIRPDHLGDMLLTTPAILWLKRRQPELEIHALCSPGNAALLRQYTALDRVLPLDSPGFQRGGKRSARNAPLLARHEAKRLRRIGYDSALIMRHDDWFGAMLATMAGIPERVGYRLPGVAPFLTRGTPLTHEHALVQNMRLAAFWLGCDMPSEPRLRFPVASSDASSARHRLTELGIASHQPIICLHPGAGAASKLWRSDGWARVADSLVDENEVSLVITGAPTEKALADDIARQMRSSPTVISDLSIGELAALYHRARLALGPDSGVMHLAAAVGTATVTLFGPADPVEFAPWGDRARHKVVASDMACRPCRILDWRGDDPANHPCVRDITEAQVLAAAREAMSAQANADSS